MKNDYLLKYYKTIGEIHSTASKETSLDEILKKCIHLILDICYADYAVVWFALDEDKTSVLRPFSWICPMDLTLKSHQIGDGSVGRVFETQKVEKYLEYKENMDSSIDNDFEGIKIGSIITIPLSNKNENLGCLQLIKNNSIFTEEEADLCEIFSFILSIEIDENPNVIKKFKYTNVIASLKDLKKNFVNGNIEIKVLKGVNLDIYEGEFLVILGESGCGKSTLLNIIGGLDVATSGSYIYNNQDITKISQKELTEFRKSNVGFVFQDYNLMPNLNAKQNIDLIGELVDNPRDSIELLEVVGLGNKAASYPSELSGGQQQRVSIARALVKSPKLVLADEPTASLDYETSKMVLSAFENITKNGTTLIMVTHNREIGKMADRVVSLRDGNIYEILVNKNVLKAEDLVW